MITQSTTVTSDDIQNAAKIRREEAVRLKDGMSKQSALMDAVRLEEQARLLRLMEASELRSPR